MDRAEGQRATEGLAQFLAAMSRKGVKLWVADGQLRYKAPKGSLIQEEIETLRASKGQIVDLLERADDASVSEPGLISSQALEQAPLSYSQLEHLHTYRLGERGAVRQIASATRMTGPLNLDAMRASFRELVRRHGALRTKLVERDGTWMQHVQASIDSDLELEDLTALPLDLKQAEIESRIRQLIMEPIDIKTGPLFGAKLLKLDTQEHVLIVALEHIISDGYSLNILLQDLLRAYAQLCGGGTLSLPPIPLQFADYAAWQRGAGQARILRNHAHLSERLSRLPILQIPNRQASDLSGWGTAPIKLGQQLKEALGEWCRLRRTTVVMAVFTAFVAVMLRWCRTTEAAIRYQSDGRFSENVENTIGYFATPLYVRVRLSPEDSFTDLLNRVTTEYCAAYEHCDFSYAAAQMPKPDFIRIPGFNWIRRRAAVDSQAAAGKAGAITCSPIRFRHPMIENADIEIEPHVFLVEDDTDVTGDFYFPRNRFSEDEMLRFGRNVVAFVEALLLTPDQPVVSIPMS